jgi:hypothetical protein
MSSHEIAPTGPGGYMYSFWPKVKSIRMNMDGFGIYDTVRAWINGSPYSFTAANIISGICSDLPPGIIAGKLYSPGSPFLRSGQVVINSTTSFDSIRFDVSSGASTGVAYTFEFAQPDTGINIYEPFTPTAYCTGDNMTVGFAGPYKFKSGNVFTVELSDPYGSFGSSTVLGTVVSSDSSGTINWTIPSTFPAGGNYRLRVSSTNPARTSLPSDVPITIGQWPPTVIATSNSPVCEGHPIRLYNNISSTNFQYEWMGPNGSGSWYIIDPNPVRQNASFFMAGSYILKVSSYGCAKYDTIEVVVNPGPGPITATSNSPVCYGDTLKLKGTINEIPGTTYSWSGPGGMPAFTDTAVKVPNVFIGGNYIITASLYNCTSFDTAKVEVKPKPVTAAPTNNGPLCIGDTLKLKGYASTGAQFIWTGPGSFLSHIQNPVIPSMQNAKAGTYVVTAIANGCTAKDSTIVLAKPLPDTPKASLNTPLCTGDRLYLVVADNAPGAVYSWVGPGTYQSQLQNPVINNVKLTTSGRYIVTVDLNGCLAHDTVDLIVNAIPQPQAFSNGVICEGDTIELAAGDTLVSALFSWTGPEGFKSWSRDTIILNAKANMSGLYTVTSVNYNCSNTDTVSMLVKPMPVVPKAGNNSPLCSGTELNLSTATSTTGVTYKWTGPGSYGSVEQNPAIGNVSIAASGIYKVVTDLNGCSTEDTTMVLIKPTPVVAVSCNSPLSIGQELKFRVANHMPGTLYSWNGPAGFTSRAQEPIINKVLANSGGSYTVVTNLDGCIASTVITVVVNDVEDTGKLVLYPNPNFGNFTISGLLKTDQPVLMKILNSVGQEIYTTTAETVNRTLFHKVELPYCANGMYILHIRVDGRYHRIPFIISR